MQMSKTRATDNKRAQQKKKRELNSKTYKKIYRSCQCPLKNVSSGLRGIGAMLGMTSRKRTFIYELDFVWRVLA